MEGHILATHTRKVVADLLASGKIELTKTP